MKSRDFSGLLITPALVLLVLVFFSPLIWFFAKILSESGSLPEFFTRVSAILTSRAVVTALATTNWISILVTLLCLLISYPLAYYMANHKGFSFSITLFCIVIPYFTSIIVRTYSLMVILGRHGLVNQALMQLGVIKHPLALLYSQTGVIIGMVYVLLPYMVLTLFGAMKTIDSRLMRAAQSLGASFPYSFRRVYFPLSVHGVISGSLIVFIVAVGFFITPALMGGPTDVMIVMLIERSVEITYDWFSAAVMSLALLVVTFVLYGVYYRLTDIRQMMGGGNA